MKMPTLSKPRAGWTKEVGRFLLHANWSKSWDGWGRRMADGKAIAYDSLAIQPFVSPHGIGLIFVLWKLRIQIAYAMSVPAGEGGERG